jgi:Leucine-rich repeat (LRR) protein
MQCENTHSLALSDRTQKKEMIFFLLFLFGLVAAQPAALATFFRSLNCPKSVCESENPSAPVSWNNAAGNVVRIDLANLAGLNGTIDPIIGQLTDLTDLRLRNVSIKGTLPTEIGLLKKLSVCLIDVNDITGQLPDAVWSLLDMRFLGFSFNANLTGTISSAVGALTNLIQLRLDSTSMGGPVPWSSLGTLTQLQILHLHACRFSGTIGTEVGLLRSLVELRLQFNQFSSTLPAQLGLLSSMTVFQARANELVGPLVKFPPSLVYLDTSDNKMTGIVDVAGLTNLFSLVLQENEFTALAESIGTATSLQVLHLSGNSMTGTLPTTLGNLLRLSDLRLQSNAFVGELPVKIFSNYVSLTTFLASDNMFTGPLPTFANTSLQYLQVENNSFTGVADLTRYTSLISVTTRNNCFERVDVAMVRGPRQTCRLDCMMTQAEGCTCNTTPKSCSATKTTATTATSTTTAATTTTSTTATTTSTTATTTTATTTTATTATTDATTATAATTDATTTATAATTDATTTATTTATTATTTTTAATTTTTMMGASPPPAPSSILPIALGAGIGGFIALLLVIGGVLFALRKKRRDAAQSDDDNGKPMSPYGDVRDVRVPPRSHEYASAGLHEKAADASYGASALSNLE